MRPFSLLIKPSSADCNLRCEYCFYLDHASLYPETSIHRMSEDTLEEMIRSYMETNQPMYSFGWQGGEPTLMGVDFFKKVVEYQQKYGNGRQVSNGLQTNGTLITDEMAELFAKNKFLLGVSLDGPEHIHDHYRVNVGNGGTHAKVMQGIDRLKKHGVEFNILTLVSQSNVGHAKEVYHYLKSNGFYFHQYIPCVEFDAQGNHVPYSITGKQWGQFLIELFNEWKKEDTYRISIRGFDAILSFMVLGQMNVCTMGGNCCQYFVVEYNGDIYPCDFFVEEKLKLGNLNHDTWQDMQDSDLYKEFGHQKNQWNEACKNCKYLYYCSGDCLKHRIYHQNKPQNISWLCEGWKMFFDATLDDFRKIAKEYMKNHMQNPSPVLFENRRIDRNGPCFCGSGKKYKHCHG